jgi:ABC-type transport system involved in cytochrome c biogenesis permease subunit
LQELPVIRLRTNPLVAVAALAAGLLTAAIALIFFYAPTDADQGFSQRIFYFHVPAALTAYACFGWGGWKAMWRSIRASSSAC